MSNRFIIQELLHNIISHIGETDIIKIQVQTAHHMPDKIFPKHHDLK